jgi:hypothetical protein
MRAVAFSVGRLVMSAIHVFMNTLYNIVANATKMFMGYR